MSQGPSSFWIFTGEGAPAPSPVNIQRRMKHCFVFIHDPGSGFFLGGLESGGTRGGGRGRRRGVVGGDDGRRRGGVGARRGRRGPFSARFGAEIPRVGGDDAIFGRSTRARALQRRSAFPDPAEAAFFAGIFDVFDFLGVFRAISDPRLSRARRRGA